MTAASTKKMAMIIRVRPERMRKLLTKTAATALIAPNADR